MTKCKSCGKPIYWGISKNGKYIPFDIATSTPHWATCPDAGKFRKPKTKKEKEQK